MSAAPIDELAALSLAEPYSCTYLCGDSFPDSKTWRQHELRAHRQVEIWRCTVPLPDNVTECGTCFYALYNFAFHIETVHKIPSNFHTSWIEDGHIYPEGQGNFWCGFCRKIVALKGKGVDAWLERLDHLQAHFDKGHSLADGWLKLQD